MAHEYTRNLRGQALAKEVQRLNGHQQELKFFAFHPIWAGFLLLGSLSVAIPPLVYIFYIGLIGTLVEALVWSIYFFKTRRVSAYPGLLAWADIKIRRLVMSHARLASRLGLP